MAHAFLTLFAMTAAALFLRASAAADVRFDFETGDLQGWKVVEGQIVRPVTNRANYHNGGAYASRQGKWHLSTVEGVNDTSADPQMGVIESPVFVLQGPTMTFLVGGGKSPQTYVALCTLDGREILKANGQDSEQMGRVQWQAEKLVGKKVFLRVVDANQGGWGHVTFDDFIAQGTLDPAATREHFAKRKMVLARVQRAAAAGADPANPAAIAALRGHRRPGGALSASDIRAAKSTWPGWTKSPRPSSPRTATAPAGP